MDAPHSNTDTGKTVPIKWTTTPRRESILWWWTECIGFLLKKSHGNNNETCFIRQKYLSSDKKKQYVTFDNMIGKMGEDHDDAEPHGADTAVTGNTFQCVLTRNEFSDQNHNVAHMDSKTCSKSIIQMKRRPTEMCKLKRDAILNVRGSFLNSSKLICSLMYITTTSRQCEKH